MEIRDLFVATVAMSLGGMMIYSSILNEGWCLQMKVARVIEESKGRAKARTIVGSAGSLLLLLGLYLMLAPTLFSLFQNEDDQANSHSHSGEMNFAEGD